MARRALQSGDEVGGYTIERQLGAGGSGQVYLVRNGSGELAALKRVDAHDDPVAAERLRREVRALMAVRHPAVPQVLDAELEDTETFVVFEYIEGECLAIDVADRGPLTGEELAACAERIAGALEAVHAAGVVHRDVTPSNVMMSPDGAVLIDFGLSHTAQDERLTREGLVSGTAGYVAPEVIDGEEPGPVADRWSWAATVAFAATGKAPFGTGNSAIRKTLDGKWKAPDIPGVEVLAAAMSKAPDERPGMRDVVAALRGATIVLPTGEQVAPTSVMPATGAPTAVLEASPPPVEDDDEIDNQPTQYERLAHDEGEVEEFLIEADPWDIEELAERRPVLAGSWAVALAAAAMIAPLVCVAIAVVWAVVTRTVYRRSEAVRIARARRGQRRRDTVIHAVGLPWYFTRAAVELIPSTLAAGAIGLAAAALGSWLVSSGAVAPDDAASQQLGHAIAVGIGALGFVAALWWGLWSWGTREGTYRVAEAIAPTRGVSAAWVMVAVIIAAAAGVAVAFGAPIWWWPLPVNPPFA